MSPTAEVASRMADRAAAWLASLDDGQRARAAWPFPADDERRRWFYTPTDHGGLAIGAMTPDQQSRAHQLLAAGLSRAGYVTASTIMGLENVLDELEGWRASFGVGRGRDPGRYQLRVFGPPGSDAWGWRCGGHHLSVHFTVLAGDVVSGTPCFFGADPASSPLLGPHPLRPLAGVEDVARELVRSLDEALAAVAVVSPVPPVDIVGGNRPALGEGDLPLPIAAIFRDPPEGDARAGFDAFQRAIEDAVGLTAEHLDALRYTRAARGLPAREMTTAGQEMLRELLALHVRRLADPVADREAAKFAGPRLGDFAFAWAGDTEPGRPHYYRVQGPRLLVEYDNTQRDVNHVHSVWRDPDGDFGADVLAAHYARAHQP
jgi:hypothetical protein